VGRKDDLDDAVIRHRFEVYREQTEPLLKWYPADLTTDVDATRSPIEVLGRIVSALTSHAAAAPVAS
jgi:adenylate kinase